MGVSEKFARHCSAWRLRSCALRLQRLTTLPLRALRLQPSLTLGLLLRTLYLITRPRTHQCSKRVERRLRSNRSRNARSALRLRSCALRLQRLTTLPLRALRLQPSLTLMLLLRTRLTTCRRTHQRSKRVEPRLRSNRSRNAHRSVRNTQVTSAPVRRWPTAPAHWLRRIWRPAPVAGGRHARPPHRH